MSVRTDLVNEVMVPRLVAAIAEKDEADITERARPYLQASGSSMAAGLARAGYFMRLVEAELFEPARHTAEFLEGILRDRTAEGADQMAAAARISRELADTEPLERPDPSDPTAASWRVPGPGGHVRHYVARALLRGRDAPDSKREVLYGFLLRCCEEIVDNAAAD